MTDEPGGAADGTPAPGRTRDTHPLDGPREASPNPFDRALIEQACKRAGLLWVTACGDRPRPLWHVWHEGAAYVVTGGREQPLPDLPAGAPVTVTVPSKDKGGRLVTWAARVQPLVPEGTGWAQAAAVLHAARLNPPDGEQQPQRWARESRITRLEPAGPIVEAPGSMPQGSHARPPTPTPATTRGRLPFTLGRRRRHPR